MWYQLSLEEVINRTATNKEEGLTQAGAEKRLESFGKNVLPRGKQHTWVFFLLEQFKSPLVYILLGGAILTTWLAFFDPEKWVDTIVILLAVAVNVAVGFWQEFRSNNVLEQLEKIVHNRALVKRSGEIHEIDTIDVVPGDILILKAGNNVPADARILTADHLEVSEAAMTGESAPVGKTETIVEAEVSIGDRKNMVHMGTTITRGEGTAIVVTTGSQTELGKIALLTEKTKDDPTPLQLRIGRLGNLITAFVAVASVIILIVGILEDHPWEEMITTAIAVAVAAIPEGLPAAISIVLAVSAQRILKKKGVVKHLVAAETLGSASVICADKTGTLTEGKMKVKQLITNGNDGRALDIMALANEAVIEHAEEGDIIRGETTDKAKLQAFLDDGHDLKQLQERLPLISLLTFDSNRKYLASLHENSGQGDLFVTGAPEILLSLSTEYATENGTDKLSAAKKKELTKTYTDLASEGYRMIGLADKVIKTKGYQNVDLDDEEVQTKYLRGLRFVGFAAIRDPIRDDVRESVKVAREAGVRTIMLTGDHILTAKAIGAELGFNTSDEAVLEGAEMRALDNGVLKERLKVAEVFARVNPADKLRIVEILQAQDEVVAMTGDGINDAPSLKSADIGVAVDSGTDVSKAASDLILLNDSFSIVVEAIKQGRVAFDNIRKVTVFLLAGSFTELILILAALIFRIPLPMTAVMILWTNLVEDSLPNVALSFEPGEKDVMKRPPISKHERILDSESRVIVFAVGIFTDLVLLGVFFWLYNSLGQPTEGSESLDYIRTIIFTALGLDTFFYIYSIKSLRKPITQINIFDNKLLVGATLIGIGIMLAAVYVPILNTLLGTVPLGMKEWAIILTIGVIEIIGVESAKWFFIHRNLPNKKENKSLKAA